MRIPEFLRATILGEVLLLLGIAAASVIVSQIVVFLFNRVLKALTRKTKTALDDLLIEALGRPVFLFVFFLGLYTALTTANFLDNYQGIINKGLLAIEMVLLVYTADRVARALVTWYAVEIAPRTESTIDERLLPIVRRIMAGVIYGLGALMVVRALGLDITPLIAGLGIGGLAVALALQPTPNHLLAGAYTISESKIGVGDYIHVQEGPRGMVLDIGWRTTKIRTPDNNMVVIPNARLADSIVTNYAAPEAEMVALVRCGVSYESDLDRVEKVTEEVARAVLQTTPGAVSDSKPVIRFREFGDSNIDFEVLLRVKSYPDQYPVVTAFIKELHARFRAEGIEINYPVRRLIYTPSDGAPRGL
ncbi:MAG: mechanosensitive ion channel family protein [Chloroflexi bacterium]|nr:mechanosensitive ion channel family protein [Chloroflexota bacterium]